MEQILKQGRLIFAVAIFSLGVEHLIVARLSEPTFSGESVVPVIPWVPGHPFLAYLAGLGLIAAGICIAANIRARLASILLGIFFLLCVIFLDISRVLAVPLDIGVRTIFFETLSL